MVYQTFQTLNLLPKLHKLSLLCLFSWDQTSKQLGENMRSSRKAKILFQTAEEQNLHFFAASFCLRFVVDAATNQFWLHMGASVPEAYIGRGFNSRLWSFDIKLNGHQVSFDIRLNFWSSGNKWELLWVKENIHHRCMILNWAFYCNLSRSSVLVT